MATSRHPLRLILLSPWILYQNNRSHKHFQGVLVDQGEHGRQYKRYRLFLALKGNLETQQIQCHPFLQGQWCGNSGCYVIYSPLQAAVILALIHSAQDLGQDLICFLSTISVLT